MPNDIAFKVIIKNDGISDIIFKTLMLKGEAGGTISSIEKTSSVGVVDTYTITLNDGNTSTFEVTNGSNIESIEKTATSGLIDTYTVTLTNGDTTTFEVKNGEDAQLYELPADAVVAYDKDPELRNLTSHYGYIGFDAYGIKNFKITGFTYQKTTTGKNLFDKDNPNVVDGYIYNTTFSTSNLNARTVYIPIEPNTTYTVSKTVGQRFVIATSPNIPANNVAFSVKSQNNTAPSLSVTSEASDAYLWAWVYLDGTDTGTLDEMLASVQIEKGSQATSYEPYTGGIPSPNPAYPQDIIGFSTTKELDGTYTAVVEVTDADDNVYHVTASGLAYPLYDGDVLDFENSKVIRANGYKELTGGADENWNAYASYNGYYLSIGDMETGVRQNGKCNFLRTSSTSAHEYNTCWFGVNNTNFLALEINISGVTDVTSWKTWLSNNPTYIVYPLATPTEESVTISGDTAIVENLRGWTIVDIDSIHAILDVWYYSDVEFPDGYEEVDLPIDDLLYYQDQEYIEFPTNWGFAMGYVFDADEVRFMINVTKDLHDGFRVVANKSIDLALSIYTGSGGSGLTGFNFVEGSFIREYGQIQLRLQTETAHGLTVGSLLGARVSQGRLRITFEAPQEV